jgi:hypothetical protein
MPEWLVNFPQELANIFEHDLLGPITVVAIVGSILTGTLVSWVEIRRNRRERENLTIERRRLSEVNIGMTPDLQVTPESNRAFVILRLALSNLGDGPVDLLGVLVSAKVLTSPGAGTGSRDVGWADYGQLAWNYPLYDADAQLAPAGSLMRGVSTSRLLTVSADQYPRLAVKENLDLLRTEVVINRSPSAYSENTYLMHRIFLVTRGYTLGEILAQLGGRPRDPLRTAHPQLLQFQPLAQPNYFRWSQVQKALFNINRFAFRLAIGDSDPLGKLSSPDAWRLFLLHHWDFIDDADVAPAGVPASYRFRPLRVTTGEVRDHVMAHWYPEQVLPYEWHTTQQGRDTYAEATRYCRDQLSELVDRWDRLMRLIKEARKYRPGRERPRLRRGLSPRIRRQIPDEWYPQLIHRGDAVGDEHRARWVALMREGYLIMRPLPRWSRRWRATLLRANPHGIRDIPPDPRILEPFVMRTRFFLVEARLRIDGDPEAGGHAADP